jgi:hypothetical protein
MLPLPPQKKSRSAAAGGNARAFSEAFCSQVESPDVAQCGESNRMERQPGFVRASAAPDMSPESRNRFRDKDMEKEPEA